MVHLDKIRGLCANNHVTIKQAAADLGMTEQSLHKIIKANSTKIDTLLTIAEYFKVEPAYFFDSSKEIEGDIIEVSKEELNGLLKKVIAYSIHGFGMVKLEWDSKEKKFNTYFDVLNKQFSPTGEDLEYISSLLDTELTITEKTSPKDISRLLMTEDEYNFTSAYYYGIKKMELQEEFQNLSSFMGKHKIEETESIKAEIEDLKEQIKYYESKSIIGGNNR